jgi:hypothetical protein
VSCSFGLDQTHAVRLYDHAGQSDRRRLQLDAQLDGSARAHLHALDYHRLVTNKLGAHVALAGRHRADHKAAIRIRQRAVRQVHDAHIDARERLFALSIDYTTDDAAVRLCRERFHARQQKQRSNAQQARQAESGLHALSST